MPTEQGEDQVAGVRKERLIVVSNRLPIRLEASGRGFEYLPSVGGLTTSLNAVRGSRDLLWLGWPGVNAVDPQDRTEIEGRLRREYDSIPLFLPTRRFERFYYGFSNGCLWPLFHYFPQYAHFNRSEWQAYVEVNQAYCDKILEEARPDDRIWVHDYHLMLLPAMIRRALPGAAIGFFLHIPFPSYEVFRILPWRDEILEGLLGADLVGFHSFGYARHYLSSLLRLLGLEQDFGQVAVGGRLVKVDAFPLGVDMERFARALADPAIEARRAELAKETQGQKVILSVDRLDFTKGILERLSAYERFLERYSRWRGKVKLIAVCVPSRTRVPEYQSMRRQIDESVGRINGRFGQPGWTPIWYLYRSLPFDQLVPLYGLADVALVTPLRDGMNLVAKEYLASHPDGTGVLVLAETAGAAEELGEALIVNPNDEERMIGAIHQALQMPTEAQIVRNRPMLSRLRRYDNARWADDFLSQLDAASTSASAQRPVPLASDALARLRRAYRCCDRRLLLLDYDGTLVPLVSSPSAAQPDPPLIELLEALAADPANDVVIISGRDSSIMQSWLGETSVDLVAEHGAEFRLSEEEGAFETGHGAVRGSDAGGDAGGEDGLPCVALSPGEPRAGFTAGEGTDRYLGRVHRQYVTAHPSGTQGGRSQTVERQQGKRRPALAEPQTALWFCAFHRR
jgi:trehalose 6-phosphate synthase/phosphatase